MPRFRATQTRVDLGLAEADVRRAVKVAALAADAKEAAREAELADNRTALLHAAKQPLERPAEAIRMFACSVTRAATPVDGLLQWMHDCLDSRICAHL